MTPLSLIATQVAHDEERQGYRYAGSGAAGVCAGPELGCHCKYLVHPELNFNKRI